MATRTALQASWELFRRLLERLWGALATLLDSSWPLLVRRGRPKISFGAAFWHPKAVPSASGRVPEAAPGAQNGSRWVFRRSGVDLGWIFVHVRMICCRFSLEPHATKARKQHLKEESRDPQRTSWLLRRAVALYCSHLFRNHFRTLHVQPFFVANPQAHLLASHNALPGPTRHRASKTKSEPGQL